MEVLALCLFVCVSVCVRACVLVCKMADTWTLSAPGYTTMSLGVYVLYDTQTCVLCMCVWCDWDQTDEALVYLSGAVWGLEV